MNNSLGVKELLSIHGLWKVLGNTYLSWQYGTYIRAVLQLLESRLVELASVGVESVDLVFVRNTSSVTLG